jgi:hypothetical protein
MDFLNKQCLRSKIKEIIDLYFENLEPFNLEKFNSNLVDPVKLAFEKIVYSRTDEEIIKNEVSRQREKNIQNKIGRLHQDIFGCIKNCEVPEAVWDVIYTNPKTNEKIYVELKNKHNTMNSSSSSFTFEKMSKKVKSEENCKCYLVEVISKHSQNGLWELNKRNNQISNSKIHRYSIDKFYEEITGHPKAFLEIIETVVSFTKEIVSKKNNLIYNSDSVYSELGSINQNVIKAIFSLGFNYPGFDKIKI